MDDNLSTKSSESSITTSGEYEIVTDSNMASPMEQVKQVVVNQERIKPEVAGKPPTSLSALALSSPEAGGDRSPTLN